MAVNKTRDLNQDERPPEVVDEEEKAVLPDTAMGGSIVRYDPLTQYLQEIRKYPILPPEEQRQLAIRYQKFKDIGAARQLITSNLRLVVKIVFEYHQAFKEVLDLIQAGNIGLMQALRKFDPYRRTRFSSYATYWIKAYILKYILDNFSLVKFATTNERRKLFFNLKRERERLEREFADHSPRLLAEHFGVKESDVVDIESVTQGGDLSLDAPLTQETTESFAEQLPAQGPALDDALADAEYRRLLQNKFLEFSKTLKPRELVVFRERLIAEDPKTLQQIADQFGVTREAVRQMESKIVNRLKEFLVEELGELKDFEFLGRRGEG
ncbi:MAG: sigma-70 family RNA polymerase sigma factor [Acidobacteriia bacterium]|nr:sigma-70 family RNA polymerase sigma factor [Terriglobia bacterium]